MAGGTRRGDVTGEKMAGGTRRDGVTTHHNLHDLPSELMVHVLEHVDPKQLVWCASMSRKLHKLATDDGVWIQKCELLWEKKRYVPDKFRLEKSQSGHARRAYFGSIKDSQRTRITATELCSVSWSFRFKKNAGRIWTRDDPYWKNGTARTLRFDLDGSVVWDGTYGDMRWSFGEIPGVENGDGESGSTVVLRHTVMGVFPSEVVMRHSSWAFILNSPWVVYASFPLCAREPDREVSDRKLHKLVSAWQWEEADEYNRHLADSDDEDA